MLQLVTFFKCHFFLDFTTIHSDYFNFLDTLFGFESEPNIYHAYSKYLDIIISYCRHDITVYIYIYLVFDHEPILKNKIESYLQRRQYLKEEIEKNSDPSKLINLQIQASLIKLLINSGKMLKILISIVYSTQTFLHR